MEVDGEKPHKKFRICQTRSRTESKPQVRWVPNPSFSTGWFLRSWNCPLLTPQVLPPSLLAWPSIFWWFHLEEWERAGLCSVVLWAFLISKRHSGEWRKNLSNFLNLLTPRRQEWKSHIFVIKMIAAICRPVWGHKHLPGRFSVSRSERKISPEPNPFPW